MPKESPISTIESGCCAVGWGSGVVIGEVVVVVVLLEWAGFVVTVGLLVVGSEEPPPALVADPQAARPSEAPHTTRTARRRVRRGSGTRQIYQEARRTVRHQRQPVPAILDRIVGILGREAERPHSAC
jgi:hypothetical protein